MSYLEKCMRGNGIKLSYLMNKGEIVHILVWMLYSEEEWQP